ncbi:mechanosensitive ion channel family protein [Pseudochryseolinea flava]|uniref:Mechanosensitive ion channel family protein n=1 Tax=Pseudochryseolinea flava TaxID=2059302 RepID=A0A364Y058_9BACT|nr:mechanosensitive ion channel family protein [Pseudochryseolinea flava]RAV99977.1 mechanosensitive ion channel family protein [Pseudochryseolinea flava]
MNDFLQQTYYGNTVADYAIVIGVLLFAFIFLKILKRVVITRVNKVALRTTNTFDEYVVHSIDSFALPILLVIVVYSALSFLSLSGRVASVIDIASTVAITYFVLRLISSLILRLLETRIRGREHGETKIKQLGGLMLVINIVIWIAGIVFVLDNMGKDVTTIVTGLGIGGIAIALAAQNILGDLFNYFVIYFDRPFEVGDFIVVDDKMGTVEYLGIKTSRIRSLSGEEIVIGNSNLTGSRIHNFKRLAERRVVFTLNIDYRTPAEKLKLVPDLIRLIITRQPNVRFDRSHFATYGDWSLKFETVYFVLDPDYNKFMDIQQQINFDLYAALEDHQIFMVTGFHMSLAPPSQPSAVKQEEKKDNGLVEKT